MTDLAIHQITQKQIDNFIDNPSHALAIYGPPGSGKKSIIDNIAKMLITDNGIRTFNIIASENETNGIEDIRKINKYLKTKDVDNGSINKIITIENFDSYSIPAQNALLKNLEEPPIGALIIISAINKNAVLPTINSRVQSINLILPAPEQIVKVFENQGYDNFDINKSLSISGGLPGLMKALLDDTDHNLLRATQTTKELLMADVYDRMIILDTLSKDKSLLLGVCVILQQMAHLSILSLTEAKAARWMNILATSYECEENISKNGNTRLITDKLALQL